MTDFLKLKSKKHIYIVIVIVIVIACAGIFFWQNIDSVKSTPDVQISDFSALNDEDATSEESALAIISIDESTSHSMMYRAGFITQSMPNEEFSEFLWKEFQRAAPEYDFEMLLFIGESDPAIEAAGIEQCIMEGHDAIFINPSDVEAIIPALIKAKEAGLIVGMLSSDLPPEYQHLRDFFWGFDDFSGSQLAGEFVSRTFPDGANYVEIGGQDGHEAQIKRRDGFRAGIADNIIELDSQNCTSGWNTNEARRIMENFIDKYGDKIDVVWCHWDNGVSGVVEALQNKGRNDLTVIGMDGNSIGYQQIRDGTQTLTIGYHFTNMVWKSIDSARIMLDGGKVNAVNILPFDMITQEALRFEVLFQ